MIKIVYLETQNNYILLVGFSTGEYKTFDLSCYAEINPKFKEIIESEDLYKQAKIDVAGGGIIWNDSLDLSADGLYEKGTPAQAPQKVFFTADLHFGHENVIRFDERPFSSIEEMDAELVKRWNAKVQKGDLVYVIGDFIWKSSTNEALSLIKSLNGQIILIKGNHDRFLHNASAKKALAAVKDYDDIAVRLQDGALRRCILSHYFIPFYNGHRHNAILLHGHSHTTEEANEERRIVDELNSKGYDLKVYNVGCMYWDYEPVTLDEILAKDGDKNE